MFTVSAFSLVEELCVIDCEKPALSWPFSVSLHCCKLHDRLNRVVIVWQLVGRFIIRFKQHAPSLFFVMYQFVDAE